MSAKEYLYLLECEGFYKIGISNNPKMRFTAIRTANPFEVKPVLCIFSYCRKKTHAIEKQLHGKFRSICHRNEWFTKDTLIYEEIKKLIDNKKFFHFEDFNKFYYGVSKSKLQQNATLLTTY
jgi:hypothetical protein